MSVESDQARTPIVILQDSFQEKNFIVANSLK